MSTGRPVLKLAGGSPLSAPGPVQPTPLRSVTMEPEATAEERLGDPVDARHGQDLVVPIAATGYPWEVLSGIVGPKGPYGNEAELVGQDRGWSSPHGDESQNPFADRTPDTHAAPWPKGVEQSTDPDASARRLQQSMNIHASNMGGSARLQATVAAQQDAWSDFYTVGAGSSVQDPSVPGQIKAASAGWGTTDRSQSFARQNEYGFDAAHSHRRYATGSIPGNYLWMKPGGRPMVKSQPGPARPPVGEVSPFTGQDLRRSYGLQGAVLADSAVEYVSPPEPYLAPDYGEAPDAAPVAWW